MANFFRFTHWLTSDVDCDGWFWHFKQRDIPCAVIASESPTTGIKTYAVYREGIEAGSDKKKYNDGNTGYGKKGRFKIIPMVVRSANGWQHFVEQEEEEVIKG